MSKLLPNRTSGNIFTAISIHVAIQQTFITLNRFGNWASKPGVKLQISIWIPGCLASMVLLPMKAAAACSVLSHPIVSDCLKPHGLQSTRSSEYGISQARILEWLVHFLLQGKFLTQGSNPHLLLGRQILHCWVTGEASSKNQKKNRMGLKFTRSINNFLALQ